MAQVRKLLLLVTVVLSVGCGGQPRHQHVFIYAQEQPQDSLRGQSMVFFQQQLQERSGGRIKVELYCGGVLGTERETMDLVATGVLQGTRGGFFADANPQYNLFTMPFLVAGWDEAIRLVNSEFTQRINRGARASGWHVPATGISQGFRAHTNNVRPITHPDDMRGLKMRVPPQDVFVRTAKAFGARTQEIAAVEMYQALQTGVVDGQDNPPSNIWDYKVYEVSKYLTVTNYATGPDPFLVHMAWYESLPGELQEIFDQVAVEAIALSDRLNRERESQFIQKLSEKLQVNYVTGRDLQPFREAVQPVYDYYVQRGDWTSDDLAAARAAAQGAE